MTLALEAQKAQDSRVVQKAQDLKEAHQVLVSIQASIQASTQVSIQASIQVSTMAATMTMRHHLMIIMMILETRTQSAAMTQSMDLATP